MLRHDDEAMATILLSARMSAEREELLSPLTAEEYHRLRDLVSRCRLKSVGGLLGVDVSGLKYYLDVSEQEAYRIRVLLERTLPLSYELDRYYGENIELIAYGEAAYPEQLAELLGAKAPPFLYATGNLALLGGKGVALLGATLSRAADEMADALLERLIKGNYALITGGERGLARKLEYNCACAGGGYISVVDDSLSEHAKQPFVKEALETGRALLISQSHPREGYGVERARSRGKCIYALSGVGIVLACESERGVTYACAAEALREKYSPRLYSWSSEAFPGNIALIKKGAHAFTDAAQPLLFIPKPPQYEQLSLI